MDWNKIGLIAVAGYFIWQFFSLYKSGGFHAMMEKSRNAPQHWGTFVFLIAMVILFVYFLIKL